MLRVPPPRSYLGLTYGLKSVLFPLAMFSNKPSFIIFFHLPESAFKVLSQCRAACSESNLRPGIPSMTIEHELSLCDVIRGTATSPDF